MGVSVGPKMPVIRSLGPTSAGTQDGTFNNSANWGVTPGSLGDSDIYIYIYILCVALVRLVYISSNEREMRKYQGVLHTVIE